MSPSNDHTGEGTTAYRLAKIMQEKGITDNKLSVDTGISYTTIRRVKSGDQIGFAATWKTICDYLGVGMDDIFGGEDGRFEEGRSVEDG